VLDYLAAEKDKANVTNTALIPPVPAPVPVPVPIPVPAPIPAPAPPVPPDPNPAPSPAPAGTHRVTAIKLNIREFPFVGAVAPPLVGTLDQGAVITVLGVYQPANLAIGWGCISPDGNQWVSMQWVEAV
jgi:hypothetical protein